MNQKGRGAKFLLLGIIISLAFTGTLIVMLPHTPSIHPIEVKIDHRQELLTRWVYHHSNRISYQTCYEIVNVSLKTDHPLLMLALMEMESEFCPIAVSSKGAIGLTQVLFEVHGKGLIRANIIRDKRDLFNIDANIKAGNLILSDNLKSSNGDVARALILYLGGRDGAYLHRILNNAANLYLLTEEKK